MVFIEEIPGLKGRTVRFTQMADDEQIVQTGTLIGLSGSGSALITAQGSDFFVSLKNIYKMGEEVPDAECERAYRIAKYMGRINSLRELVDFSLEFPLTTDEEAREAYIRRAYELIGFEKKD